MRIKRILIVSLLASCNGIFFSVKGMEANNSADKDLIEIQELLYRADILTLDQVDSIVSKILHMPTFNEAKKFLSLFTQREQGAFVLALKRSFLKENLLRSRKKEIIKKISITHNFLDEQRTYKKMEISFEEYLKNKGFYNKKVEKKAAKIPFQFITTLPQKITYLLFEYYFNSFFYILSSINKIQSLILNMNNQV